MCAIDQMSARPDEETQNRKEAVSRKKMSKGNSGSRKEAVSRKKMNEGNGGGNQCKEILGWILNTHPGIMELTNHKEEHIKQIFAVMWHKERVSMKKWQCICILGELHYMEMAIPGATSLFGGMQLSLMHLDSHLLHDHLTDFEMLTLSIAHQQPTHLSEVMPNCPCVIDANITTRTKMGGVHFAKGRHPIIWQTTFAEDIQQHIVTIKNLGGNLTNSDLEQAGVLIQANLANNLYN